MKWVRVLKKITYKLTLSLLSVALLFSSFPIPLLVVSAETSLEEEEKKDYVYLADIDYAKAHVDYGSVKINQNDSGEMISILVDGKKTYSMNAIFAHASSTLIYDVGKYDFDTFTTYAGVDSSKGSNGNGVKFSIYGSKEENLDSIKDNDWVLLGTSSPVKGNNNALKFTASIEDYKWLKLYADKNGENSYDHAVWVDPMIYNSSTYSPQETPNVDWILTVAEYDEQLLKYSNDDILKNKELKLKLLQRTFVNRVDYSMLQAFVNKSKANLEFMQWLFQDEETLEEYLLGGTPEGGNYIRALTVFSELYHDYKDDLKDPENKETYKKMMMAISLTYSVDVNFWQTANPPVVPVRTPSNEKERYKIIKRLLTNGYTFDQVSTYFEKDLFKSLEVEEMRWVVNNRISDIEIAWLNWYTQMTKAGKTSYNADGYTNPYTYIYYSSGWYYEDPDYYKANSDYCAYGNNQNKKNSSGYKRGVNCNEKYGLEHFNLETRENSPLRLWTIWEEDGVCGSLAGTGSNIEMAYGRPSTLVSQPGHAAYFVSKETTWNGEKRREWQIGNAAAGWAASYKGERMMLDWGTRKTGTWTDSNNGAYLVLAQRAVDEWDKYQKAFFYNLLADVRVSLGEKISTYEQAIQAQSYNLDSWYQLIQTYLKDSSKTDDDYYQLARQIVENFQEFPLAMHDLLKLIDSKIINNSPAYAKLVNDTLNKLKNVKDGDYFQASVIREIAKYLLGMQENNDTATFSFDGEYANELRLLNKAAEQKIPFEYTLNYEYDAEHGKVSDTTEWTEVTDGETSVDLSSRIEELNTSDDIVVHLLVNSRDDIDNLFFIDLQDGISPKKIYANSLENKVAGVTDSMEWYVLKDFDEFYDAFMNPNGLKWQKFKDSEPPVSDTEQTMILVRDGYTENRFPSDFVFLTFEPDENNKEAVYVPNSRLTVETSSDASDEETKENLLDGNFYSFWHSKKNTSEQAWVTIMVNKTIQLSKLEYVPRQDFNESGRITKVKIETSMDGKKWETLVSELTWKNDDSIKTYVLETPIRTKYVRLTSLDSVNHSTSAAMIRLYENTLTTTKSVHDLSISYIKDGYVYNGEEHRPLLTVQDDGIDLIEDNNYSVEYQNNTNAGVATIEVTGLGIYDGTVSKEFTISKADIPTNAPSSEMTVDVSKKTLADISLPEGWSWKEPNQELLSGDTIVAVAVHEDKNNYEQTEVEVTIIKEKGSHPVITVQGDKTALEYEFTGDEVVSLEDIKKLITITDEEDGPIDINDSKKVTFSSNIEWNVEGTYHIYITVVDSDGNQVDWSLPVLLVDREKDPVLFNENDFEVLVDDTNLYYTGESLTIPVHVIDKQHDNHELTVDLDYELSLEETVSAGTYRVTVTGKGIYEGTLTHSYTIHKAQVPKELVTPEMHVSYDTLTLEQIPLPEGWQWKDSREPLALGNNAAQIIYLGDANHERYEMEILVIRDAKEEESKGEYPVISIEKKDFYFDIKDPEVDLDYFKNLLTISDKEDGSISVDSDAVELQSDLKWEVGTWTITVKVTDKNGNVSQIHLHITITDETVPQTDINTLTINIEAGEYIYTGKEFRPRVTIYDGETLLEEDKDYTVIYQDNIEAGTATITIAGKGIYTGFKMSSFTIEKAGPESLPSANIEVSESTKTAKEVPLPEGWHWEDETVTLKEGENKLTAVYDGDNNHVSMDVIVTVKKKDVLKPNASSSKNKNTNKNKASSSSSKPSNSSVNNPSNIDSNANSNTNTNSNTNENTNSNVSSNTNTNTNSNQLSSNQQKTDEEKIEKEPGNIGLYVLGIGVLGVGIITLIVLLKNRLQLNKKK